LDEESSYLSLRPSLVHFGFGTLVKPTGHLLLKGPLYSYAIGIEP
jgi:hypothetical protein